MKSTSRVSYIATFGWVSLQKVQKCCETYYYFIYKTYHETPIVGGLTHIKPVITNMSKLPPDILGK